MSRLSKAVKKTVKNPLTYVNPFALGPAVFGYNLSGGDGSGPEGSTGDPFADYIKAMGSAGKADYGRLLEEAGKQRGMQTSGAVERKNQRDLILKDYANLLTKTNQRNLNDAIPGIAEQANMKGVYRSSGLGNAVAREAGKLASNTAENLSQQGLIDRESYIGDLSGIENQYMQGRNSATQREMSLQDYARQLAGTKILGEAMQPKQPDQPSGKAGQLAPILKSGAGVVSAVAGLKTGGLASKGSSAASSAASGNNSALV